MDRKPQIIAHSEKALNYTLFSCQWVPSSARFVVLGNHARNTGAIEVFELSKGSIKSIKSAEKKAPIKCGTFGASSLHSRHLATGDFEGHLMTWDLERPDAPAFSVKAHESMINAIDGCGGLGIGGGAPELVTGGRDGCVKVWDVRQPDPVAEMSPVEGQNPRDCWSVAFGNSFNDEERCVAAGYDNGDLKIFDLRTMSLRWETHLKNGICSVQFDRKDINMNKLLVTGLDSKLTVFDMRTQHPDHGFASVEETSHKSTIWTGQHLPQNRDVFMTTGGNGGLNLWKYNYPAQRTIKDDKERPMGVAGSLTLLNNVTMSTQPINCLAWSPDKMGLAVCTAFDQAVRVLVVTNLNLL